MVNKLIQPSTLKGEVVIPPSKSLVHRAIISASLAQGRSTISNIQLSDDIKATIEGMRAFGAEIQYQDHQAIIKGIEDFDVYKERVIDCNESGSTLRFLMPLATLFKGPTTFVGRGKLGTRPLDTYQEIFEDQGIVYRPSGTIQLETVVEGHLKPGDYSMPGDVSSQFITGMLFTLPLMDGNSTLTISSELESIGYVDLTLTMLKRFGITIDHNNYRTFKILGNQKFQAKKHSVEGDFSQAAFFLSAGALGSDVVVEGLNTLSQQGDRGIVDILESLGAQVEIRESSIKAVERDLQANVEVDGSQVPDIIPISALVACLSQGKTIFKHLNRLRIKESDRLEATAQELSKLGAKIKAIGDELHVEGVDQLQGGVEVWSHKDHRIAMMLAIASTRCKEPITVIDSECVAKSYPNFWEDFEMLGGQVQ